MGPSKAAQRCYYFLDVYLCHGNQAHQVFGVKSADVAAADGDAALLRVGVAHDEAADGGFAAAGRTDEGGHAAFGDGELGTAHYGFRVGFVVEMHVFQTDIEVIRQGGLIIAGKGGGGEQRLHAGVAAAQHGIDAHQAEEAAERSGEAGAGDDECAQQSGAPVLAGVAVHGIVGSGEEQRHEQGETRALHGGGEYSEDEATAQHGGLSPGGADDEAMEFMGLSCVMPLLRRISEDVQCRQVMDDFLGFEADGDDAQQQFQRVARVVHGFAGPVVGVVGDAGLFVGGDGLPFHHPFQRRFAVDDVVISGYGDVFHGDFVVVDDAGFVVFFGEFHFAHGEVRIATAENGLRGEGKVQLAGEGDAGVDGHGFVMEVQGGKLAPRPAEGGETGAGFHARDARQLFAEVVGIARAVFFAVQQAVDVIEDVFFADGFGVGFLEMRQRAVGDGAAADEFLLRCAAACGEEVLLRRVHASSSVS